MMFQHNIGKFEPVFKILSPKLYKNMIIQCGPYFFWLTVDRTDYNAELLNIGET